MKYDLEYAVKKLDDDYIEFELKDVVFNGFKFKLKFLDEQLKDSSLSCEYSILNVPTDTELVQRLAQYLITKILEESLEDKEKFEQTLRESLEAEQTTAERTA